MVVRKKTNKKKDLIEKEPINQSYEKILIISVDRDNDIGEKAGITGPIIGLKNNTQAATKFAIADPEDSDGNCMFGAIKKYNELIKENDVEIVTLTGHSKSNLFYADKNIALQLKHTLEIYPATAAILVTDGAEDDQVLPIIQNYIPVISKDTIIVRQSKNLESTFYTIKKAFRDPFFARIVYGVPAVILLLFVFFKNSALQIIALLLGLYFLIKGFNLDFYFIKFYRNIFKRFSIHRLSLPFYLAFIFFSIFSIVKGINLFNLNTSFDLLFRTVYVLRAILLYLVLAISSAVIASIIDLFYFKKVYLLGRHIFTLLSIFIFATLIDFALQLIISEIEISLFITAIILSVIFLILIGIFTNLFNISSEVTVLLVGLSVRSKYGLLIGKVVDVDEKKQIIIYEERTNKKIRSISKKNFSVRNGFVII
ncbi:DUF373 family protein [archaeon]|jgi:putative membrane protein|nr:DUF373 family protein [archaeon]MDD2477763.1 DUF373 family protein [Candidatus ainarchaeum sp.]MDD3084865.1 DUF373 family protein [Candidatus ainarchaeum sp.]MDD4221199.1 DUF373 family protein [Candidatus ainarchaeum sp.]MDD4662849.1 DUF373 family protein [Candidatus ainarchaeum sp.]